jgi:hypothetical protein
MAITQSKRQQKLRRSLTIYSTSSTTTNSEVTMSIMYHMSVATPKEQHAFRPPENPRKGLHERALELRGVADLLLLNRTWYVAPTTHPHFRRIMSYSVMAKLSCHGSTHAFDWPSRKTAGWHVHTRPCLLPLRKLSAAARPSAAEKEGSKGTLTTIQLEGRKRQ